MAPNLDDQMLGSRENTTNNKRNYSPSIPDFSPPTTPMNAATYVLPIKSSSLDGVDELTDYLRRLRATAPWLEVIVVDSSPAEIFAEQVADLALYVHADPREYFPAGRTLDYNGQVFLTTGSTLYSNRSTLMMRIEFDDAGRHDYLLTPCSARMFQLLHNLEGHPSCHANLARALQPFNISDDDIHATSFHARRYPFEWQYCGDAAVVEGRGSGGIACPPRSNCRSDCVLVGALEQWGMQAY
jgi:hypothetical protein